MKTVPDFEGAKEDLRRIGASRLRIVMSLSFVDAWHLFALAQLALRHPGIAGDLRERGEKAARFLQELLAVTPALASVAEAGWDAEFDETAPTPAPAQGQPSSPPEPAPPQKPLEGHR